MTARSTTLIYRRREFLTKIIFNIEENIATDKSLVSLIHILSVLVRDKQTDDEYMHLFVNRNERE